MLRVALKAALYNRRRLLGTGLSVVIGIAFLAGTFVFTDTINRTFDNLFADVYENTDAYVRSENKLDLGFGQTMRDRIPESHIDDVASVPGVREAVGVVGGFARLIGSDGQPIGRGSGSPTFGQSVVKSDLIPWTPIGASRFPNGPNEIMIDVGSAKEGKFALGDTVGVVTKTGEHRLTLVGTVKFGSAESPGGATFALFDLATAQRLIGSLGQIDAVMASAENGVTENELAGRLQAKLGTSVEVLTGAQITKETQGDLRDALRFITILLLVFAGVALFVASFIIYNTFSIIVAQTQRENALLRAVGASRPQIVVSVIVESLIVGAIASILGFGAGVGLSSALKAVMARAGIDIPTGSTVLLTRTVIVSFIVGVVITVVAAASPSLRASRVPPVAAIRGTAIDRSATSKSRAVGGAVVVAVGSVLLFFGLTGQVRLLAVGVPTLFVGFFVLGPVVARPVARIVGAPLRLAGVTGALAQQNSMRNPKRTARTAAALMVGVSLVTGISVLASSTKSSIRSLIGEQFTGDFVVQADTQGVGALPQKLADELNQLPEVAAATGIQIGFGVVERPEKDSTSSFSVVDPKTLEGIFDMNFIEGGIPALNATSILVSEQRAKADDLHVGSTVRLSFIDRKPRTLTVAGIYEKDEVAGPYTISRELYRQSGADMLLVAVFGMFRKGIDATTAMPAIRGVADRYPNGKLATRTQYITDQARQIDQFVNLMYGLLLLAVVIGVFGVANTLSLSVFERTRELALLRAVGAYQRQVRAAVTWEAVITAMIGTVEGIVIGILLGDAVVFALRDEGLRRFSIPFSAIVVVVVLAVIAGVIAAVRPARRAAKLDILGALARH